MKTNLICAAALALAASAPALAQTPAEEPIITFHTAVYANHGPNHSFSFSIGGNGGGYIDVDCGFGATEYELEPAVFDASTQTINATVVTCKVNEAATVKVYGDPAGIDYFYADGCYITDIDFSRLTDLQILNLEHNLLSGLDLTPFSKLQAVYLTDNPYSEATPLVVGPGKPDLALLEIGTCDYVSESFNLSDYPSMVSFNAYAARNLKKVDPTKCPNLVQLSIDLTEVSTLDVTKNSKLQILNISDTKITSIDLSGCPELTQFFAVHGGAMYSAYKLTELDLTHNPNLFYLFLGYNDLSTLDLSKNTKLFDLSLVSNNLTELDLSKNTNLYNVNLLNNRFGFATLPAPGEWNEYYYEQQPMQLERSYKKGSVIDFNSTMMREGSETVATLYHVNEADFSQPILADPASYKFEDGKLTLLETFTDSVFVSFDNSMFADCALVTSNFMVKSATDYGKDSEVLTFLPAANDGAKLSFTIGVAGASVSTPKTFYVDFGNNRPVAYTATGQTLTDGVLVDGTRRGGGYVRVLAPEGVDITAFGIEGQTLYSAEVDKARTLRELTMKGTGLYELNVESLRCLQSLVLEGNSFYKFSIKGKNYYFVKTVLSNLDLHNNNITEFEFDGLDGIALIDLSDNNLEEFTFATAKLATDIDISGNKLTVADLAKCASLERINLSGNAIAELTLPEESVLKSLDISGNAMTLANLPEPSLFAGEYSYAPQAKVAISVKGPGADLFSQYRTVDGATTSFAWFKTDGTQLAEGTDYSITEGKTRFLDSTLGKVYCVMTHPAFPAFSTAAGTALLSTDIEVSAMPTDVTASFTTPVGGQTVSLSLAATAPNTSIFIDWKGDGVDLVNYDLGDTYRLFEAETHAGANVKVYTYGEGAAISVFSITGATMADLDISGLTAANTITLSGAGLTEITLPASGKIRELVLSGNKLSTIDLSGHPDLFSLSLTDNNFEGTFDISGLKNLNLLSMAANKLDGIVMDNSNLWFLDLARNNFSEIDFSKVPNVEQLSLSGNKFDHVDISPLKKLNMLLLDANRFTFATLPPVLKSYSLYVYGNQARVDVHPDGNVIDLSSQAVVDGTATTYRWFIDEPSLDEEEKWVGEELIANDEFTVENGVTTFSMGFRRLVGLMNNAAFPKLDLFTAMADLSGVENVAVGADCRVYTERGSIMIESDGSLGAARVFSVAGQLVRTVPTVDGVTAVTDLASGIYIVAVGNKAVKVGL